MSATCLDILLSCKLKGAIDSNWFSYFIIFLKFAYHNNIMKICCSTITILPVDLIHESLLVFVK